MLLDIALVGGLFCALISVTTFLTAWIELRIPKRGIVYGCIAAGALWWAWGQYPDGIGFDEVSLAVMRLIRAVFY